jgi:ABC-type antimicrobial peptide transport system permease subunit
VTFTNTAVLTDVGEHYINTYTSITFDNERYSGVGMFMVEPNFFDFFGMKIKEGERISVETDMVINEMQMQAFGEKNLLGETFHVLGLGDVKLSGIVHNYTYSTMQYPMLGLVFHLYKKELIEPYRFAYIKAKPENRISALDHVQSALEIHQTVHNPDGNRFLALTDIMDELIRPERTLSLIFGLLSLACILVVTFGIYSLISLTIEQRHKEIAIRKINGAEFPDMLRLFFREYLLLVMIGNALALPLGYYLMQRWFETYAYHTALVWWLFVMAPAVTCVIVFLSVVRKISEAARMNPAGALKTE